MCVCVGYYSWKRYESNNDFVSYPVRVFNL